MKKLLTLFWALMATTALWASNVITYTAESKLPETTNTNGAGLHTNAFNVSISSHTFSNGIGTITCDGEITTIGNDAFRSCPFMTSIEIPNSVMTIGDYAFYECTGLTSVTIPNSVTTIESWAFGSCTGLTSVTIGNSVTWIGYYAFYECTGLTSVTIPNSVTTIGNNAFWKCSGLTSVTIPNSVTTIGSWAFGSCTGLTSVTIPNSVTTIGILAFDDVNNIMYNGTATGSPWGAKCVNGYVDGYLIYSDASKTILCRCSSAAIGEITIPNSVTTIGEEAFYGCTGLTSVTIPNSVTEIGVYAFLGCEGLTSINVNTDNMYYASSNGVLFNYAKDTLIQYPTGYQQTEYIIPNSVTTIGESAFYGCSGLTSVTIPNSVTTIGNDAFWNCSGLTSVTIPNSVTEIGYQAFYECTGLTSVTIPNSVTEIGVYAFCECTGLTSVTIPNSVTTIGEGAFVDCTNLSYINFGSGLQSIGDVAFYNCKIDTAIIYSTTPPICTQGGTFGGLSQSACLFVPKECERAYQLADGWNSFDIHVLEANVVPTDNKVVVSPTNHDVTISWPINDNVSAYTLVITKNNEDVCTLTFNDQGQLLNIAFAAPGHNGAHQAPAATLTAQGYQFTVTGLTPGTAYNYSVTATDASGQTIAEHKGNFSTTGVTDIKPLPYKGKAGNGSKFFRNGQILLERNSATYTLMGQKVK